MSQALVNPDILRWARERAHLAVDRLADKLLTSVDNILAWESGEKLPTFRQAQKVANTVHVPFGYLFLSKPPLETLPIPDLRTIGDRAFDEPSPEFRDVISDVMRKWNWFSEYRRDQNYPTLPFIGKFKKSESPEKIARDISETLGIDNKLRKAANGREAFLSSMTEQAEEKGIWIMRSGIVGSNTSRPLNVEEFRGFVISDKIAPLIFLNGKDAKAAQIFTLAHELAHLWIGESGITNLSLDLKEKEITNDIERYCNHVAAEVLVPKEAIFKGWNTKLGIGDNAEQLARRFRVSSVVIARRALDLDLITWSIFWDYYQEQKEQWQSITRNKESGGDPYKNLKSRNGKSFSRAVLASVYEGRLLFRDASALLGIKTVKTLNQFAKEMKVK